MDAAPASITEPNRNGGRPLEQDIDNKDGDDDLESLLPQAHDHGNETSISTQKHRPEGSNMELNMAPKSSGPLAAYMDDEPSRALTSSSSPLFCGLIQQPFKVGNFTILFPEYFDNSKGWGVLGPHWFGPACVWLILAFATHLCLHGVYRHNLGSVSAAICYFFLALCTWRLTDVSLRDPGMCLDRELPGHVMDNANGNRGDYRFCDRCQTWQPPDGVHCPDCNCCVAGMWVGRTLKVSFCPFLWSDSHILHSVFPFYVPFYCTMPGLLSVYALTLCKALTIIVYGWEHALVSATTANLSCSI